MPPVPPGQGRDPSLTTVPPHDSPPFFFFFATHAPPPPPLVGRYPLPSPPSPVRLHRPPPFTALPDVLPVVPSPPPCVASCRPATVFRPPPAVRVHTMVDPAAPARGSRWRLPTRWAPAAATMAMAAAATGAPPPSPTWPSRRSPSRRPGPLPSPLRRRRRLVPALSAAAAVATVAAAAAAVVSLLTPAVAHTWLTVPPSMSTMEGCRIGGSPGHVVSCPGPCPAMDATSARQPQVTTTYTRGALIEVRYTRNNHEGTLVSGRAEGGTVRGRTCEGGEGRASRAAAGGGRGGEDLWRAWPRAMCDGAGR